MGEDAQQRSEASQLSGHGSCSVKLKNWGSGTRQEFRPLGTTESLDEIRYGQHPNS